MGLARNRLTAAMRLHRGRRKWSWLGIPRCFLLVKFIFTSNLSEKPKAELGFLLGGHILFTDQYLFQRRSMNHKRQLSLAAKLFRPAPNEPRGELTLLQLSKLTSTTAAQFLEKARQSYERILCCRTPLVPTILNEACSDRPRTNMIFPWSLRFVSRQK